MKKLIHLIIIIILANVVNAQENMKLKSSFIGINVSQGIHYFSDISPLNNALKANGLPLLPTNISVSHSGITLGVNRFIFLYDEHSYELNNKNKGDYELSGSGEGYQLKFGYDLAKSNNIDLCPYLGIGFQKLNWIIDKQNPISLNDALKTISLQSYQLSANDENIATVGILINLRLFSFSKKRIDFLIGGDINYLYSSNEKWRLNDQVVDVNNVDISGLSWMLTSSLRVNINKLLK